MATNWRGYLLKNAVTDSIIISKYIMAESWGSTPNQREELEAYRDDNSRTLHRVTADGHKTPITFEIIPCTLEDKIIVQNFFKTATVNEKERKVELTYWNDEDNDYKTSYFYIPNITWKIDDYDDNTINYDSTTIELVEY